jgi:predicted RNA methylase
MRQQMTAGEAFDSMTRTTGTVEQFEALLTPQGRELLDRLATETGSSQSALHLGTALRAEHPTELVVAAMSQYQLRLAARAKFTRAMEMYFTRPGLEQASSEMIARHRASRFTMAGQVADLCTGIGGDLIALAAGRSAIAVDLDPLHLRMAQLNAEVYGAAAGLKTVRDDVRNVELAGVDGVFIDPARRTTSGRMRTGASEPPLEWCLELAERVPALGVKAAPGIDHERVPGGWELELIAIGRDLKEAVAWSPAMSDVARRATLLPDGISLTSADGPEVEVQMPGGYLIDPNPAVTRAGLVQELARELGAWKIDRQIAFLSTNEPVQTPFGRTMRIIDSAPWNQKQLSAKLRELNIGAVDIRRRGLAGDVDILRKKLKLVGACRGTLVMTRVNDRPWGLICIDDE